jgi:hypothetical protein
MWALLTHPLGLTHTEENKAHIPESNWALCVSTEILLNPESDVLSFHACIIHYSINVIYSHQQTAQNITQSQ